MTHNLQFEVHCSRTHFLDSYQLPSEAERPEGAAEWVQRALRDVEERVRRHPENSNDYFFWTDMTQAA